MSVRTARAGGGRWRDGARGAINKGAGAPVVVTWNPADKTALCVLSGGNLTASTTAGDANGGVRATTSRTATGKFYYEVLVNSVVLANKPAIGVCTSTFGLGNPGHGIPNIWALVPNGTLANPGILFGNGASGSAGTTVNNTEVWATAVDLATGRIWWAKNNAWCGGGDPGAGTLPSFSTVAGIIFPFVNVANGAGITARFLSASWTYAAPSGFGEW